MKNDLRDLALAVLAGFAISIGCVVYLSVENAVAGSILFSVGLLCVLSFGLNLFTGKAPYIVKNKPSYILFTLLVWAGNFIGAAAAAGLVRCTRVFDKIIDRCTSVSETKVADGLPSLFVLGVFCGIMMFIAVDTYITQGEKRNFSSALVVVLCVSVFILAGFEHSVADMFYFMLSISIDRWILPLVVITLGNVVGGNAFCLLAKLKKD